MACYVKKNDLGLITEVRLPDGKTMSKAYYDILQHVQEGIPSEHIMNTLASLREYEGKYISDTKSNDQRALGLYMHLYDQSFRQWYGDWTTEPKINNDATITRADGETRSIYDFGKYKNNASETLYSARTAATGRLLKQVDLTVKELRDRIKLAIDAREKSKLNADYTKDQKIERERYYNKIIKVLNQQVETLIKNNNVDYVLAQGLSDMKVIKNILSGPIVSLTEIRFMDDIVQAWTNIETVLGIQSIDDLPEDNEEQKNRKERATQILNNADFAKKSIANLAKKQIVEAYNNSMPEGQEITVKDLNAFKDVSMWKSLARDITTVDNKSVAYLAKIINEANLKITKEHNRNYESIDKAYDDIKNHPEIVKNGFNIFIKEQKGALGTSTLGLTNRFSQVFYDTMRNQGAILNAKIEAAGEDKEAVKAAYKTYNDWVAKNTVLFNSAPFLNTEAYTDAQRIEVVNDLKKQGFTEDEIGDMIREAGKRYQDYNEYAEKFRTTLYLDIMSGDLEVPEGENEDEFVNKRVEEWKKINDPIAYIEHINNLNQGLFSTFSAFKGGRYAVKFPQKTVDGKDSNYYDDNFTKIAADKKLYNFYLFFRNFVEEQLSYLPQEEIDKLGSNFLPVIMERMAKEYGFSSLKEVSKNMGDWFFKQLTSVDYKENKRIDPITEKVRRSFTTKFINEDVDTEERSKDMVLMMKLFSDMALIYKHKIQIQDQVDSINDIIQSADATIVQNNLEKREEKGKAPANLQNMVGSAVLRSFYQVAPEPQGLIQNRRFYNALELLSFGTVKSKEYKQALVLQQSIQDLSKKLESDTLKEADRLKLEEQVRNLKKEYYELGGRNLSMSSVLDGMNKLTRQKGIGLNPFAAIRNLAVGGLNNFIHAYGGEDYSTKDFYTATGIIKDSAAKYLTWGNSNSINAMKILKFNLDSKIVDGEDEIFKGSVSAINKASTWETIKKYVPSPFGLMRSTDYLFKSQTSVSMMLAQKVETSKGTFNLFEVMDENLNFNSAKYGEWDVEKNGGLTFDELYDKFSAKVGQVARKLHGFAGGGLSLAAKDSMYWRMLMVFRTWLPETIANRFEKNRYDPILERNTEGYYRTFWNVLKEDPAGIFKAMYQAAVSKQVGNLSKEEVANLRKMMMELTTIMGLFSMYLALSASVGDDDKTKWKRLALNQLNLLARDMTYYLDPYSAKSLLENTVPAMTTVTQSLDALKAIGNYAVGTENAQGDPLYDGQRTILKITKALPYVNNVNRVIYYSGRMGNVR